ncbi:MAG: hypothetical protein B7Z08_12870 [Sphingomonadales bacterium 32-68-7]|nr:MAG: hypothetical protein B7Z33_08395 [Sphingomonadales bacterium 12-68-11]OYX07140.1 MAG: hypothetical protein B7Z08_12870 [Sphingomonadales bacterium 32-68-7]
MTALMMASALLLAQTATSLPDPDISIHDRKDVSYEALAQGRHDQAIGALEARLLTDPGDPALLINLGSAYALAGKTERAAAAYRAAIDSDTRYQLELADGTWVDSRRAARRALATLDRQGALAAR